MSKPQTQALPLEGITVVSLEQAVAAPFATRQLADLGARVIKIERPGVGDFAREYDHVVRGMSSQFVWLNRSKESLTLDLKHPEAAHILERLLAEADVFVQNLAPGATDRLGLAAATLTERYPRLIACDISGYGASGPYRDAKAYDLLIQCETGLVSITGTPEAPAKVGISVADISAGMYALSGVLTALYTRERTGRGTTLAVSLFDALGEWMSFPALFAAYGGSPPPRSGAYHATIAPYGPFRVGDGREINLAVQNEREWAAFCATVLERPALASDPRFDSNARRVANRAALGAEIAAVFDQLGMDEVMARIGEAHIASAQVHSMSEFWEHPQLAARDRWREVGSPVGMLRMLLPPVVMGEIEPRMDPVPALGEHTERILAALGYDQQQLATLRAEGAI